MATSKLELAVGTGQWDAGLKKAQQALNSFTQSQGGLQQALAKDNGDMQKFIQMMGKMDSTANTSKGQMNDYKRVLEQLTAQYNHMSDAQKKSIGQDYLQTIDALKQKFAQAKQQVDDFNRSLGETSNAKLPEISGVGGGLFSGGKFGGMLQVFGGNMMTKAAGLAASFASELGDAVSQGIELARAGEGIRIAFDRLGRGDILDGLREATHGTVTDLELMKAAVKFNDFKLPLEELGTMLAFAQQKAKDTGQSVDYMVDSIVTGLGRKSLMILDNLGLSAAEIKEKMAETGDMTKAVGAIIREQMQQAGDYVETAADRAAQANVNLQNKMEELGRKFGPLQEASNNLWTSMKIGIMDIVGGPLTNFLNKLTEAGRLANAYGVLGGNGKVGRMTANLSGASEGNRQSIYQQQQQKFWQYINPREQQIKDIRAWQRGERGDALQSRINAITEKYGSLDATKIQAEVGAAKKMLADYQQAAKTILNPVKADIDTSGAENNVDSLKKKLKDLEEQRKKAIKAGDTELSKNLLKQINQTKTDIRGLDQKALSTSTGNKTTPQEKASEMVANAERTYAETLQKASIRMEVGLDTTLEGKKKELSAQERLFDAYNDAYATYKDPKYKESISESADKMKSLAGEVKQMEDAIAKSKVKWEQGESGFNSVTMAAWMQGRQGDLSKAEYGSTDYNSIMANIADMNAIKTILEQSMAAGIDAAQFNLEPLWEKVFDGENIDDKVWQGMVDTINEKLKRLGIKPIKINLETGNIANVGGNKSDVDSFKNFNDKFSQLNGGVGSIVSGIRQMGVEIPKELQSTLSVLQGISTIMTGILAITTAMSAKQTAQTVLSFIPGYAHGGLIHAATGYMVPGNDHADRTLIAASSGELILNRAQQGVIASQLENGNGGGMHVVGEIQGEKIVLVANRFLKRSGQGELVTWK